jgi:two-component system response regulator YesN
VQHLARSIAKFLWISKSIEVDILIGQKVKEFQSLHQSIQSVTKCKNMLFYTKQPSIICYEDIKDEEFCKIYEDNGAIIKTIAAFRKGDTEKIENAIEQLIAHFKSVQVVPEIALIHLDSIMASIIQILSERMDEVSEVLQLYSTYKKIQDHCNVYELGKLVTEFCLFCNKFSSLHKKKESMDIVEKVMNYVDENFMKPLKIIDIAEHFFVNPAYLGQQFIKKKGYSLNHYLNSVRIEKSKELLLNTNMKIYEIALKTGYDDPNYFSAKFLEYMKQTPSDFRNSIKN